MSIWIKTEATCDWALGLHEFKCSACGWVWRYGKTKYCPECGAKMEVKDAE